MLGGPVFHQLASLSGPPLLHCLNSPIVLALLLVPATVGLAVRVACGSPSPTTAGSVSNSFVPAKCLCIA